MSKTNYGFDYNDYERMCNRFTNKLTAFFQVSPNWEQLKSLDNPADLKELINKAVKTCFPNPYKKED